MIKRLGSTLHGAINPFPIILHEWYPAARIAILELVCASAFEASEKSTTIFTEFFCKF